MSLFANLGLTAERFRADYADRQLHFAPAAFSGGVYPWPAMNSLLASAENDLTSVRLFRNGALPPTTYVESYTELGQPAQRLDRSALYGLLSTGATLVVNSAHRHCGHVDALCHELAQFSGAKTVGNLYLAFGGDGSFGRHWDTHDVFVVQLRGRKRWQVFQPTFPQPLPRQTSLHHKADCPQVPALDIELNYGDVLYIPRGWWHHAMPLDGETVHVAVGVHRPSVKDYLAWLLEQVLPQELAFRQSLISGGPAADLSEAASVLVDAFRSPRLREGFDQYVARLERAHAPLRLELYADPKVHALPLHATVRRSFVSDGWSDRIVCGADAEAAARKLEIVEAVHAAGIRVDELAQIVRRAPHAVSAEVHQLASAGLLEVIDGPHG
jgi:hypothetical protein